MPFAPSVHRPPSIENEDVIRTKTLTSPQMKGNQVDILKYPALYTAPRLHLVSFFSWRKVQQRLRNQNSEETVTVTKAYTDINPTILPASKASTPAMAQYIIGKVQTYFQAFFPFPSCIKTAKTTTTTWQTAYIINVHSSVNRHISYVS